MNINDAVVRHILALERSRQMLTGKRLERTVKKGAKQGKSGNPQRNRLAVLVGERPAGSIQFPVTKVQR